MLETTSLQDDHYLHLTISEGKLQSDFQCVHHNECEAVQRIRQEDEEMGKYSTYNVALEWYTGKNQTVLVNGNVRLQTNDNFVEWEYLEPVQTVDELTEELRSDNSHQAAFIAWVQASNGPEFHFVCLKNHEHHVYEGRLCDVDAVIESISSDPFMNFNEEDGTELRNDYITVTFDSQYGEEEGTMFWSYETDK